MYLLTWKVWSCHLYDLSTIHPGGVDSEIFIVVEMGGIFLGEVYGSVAHKGLL